VLTTPAAIHDDSARRLLDLIPLGAASLESNLPVIDYLQAAFNRAGWSSRRYAVRDDGPQRINLVVANSTSPRVLFCAHTDTVPAGEPALWTHTGGRPRTPTVRDGQVWGLGASDNLGSVALLLAMAVRGSLPRDVAIAFTADEESGALGAEHLVQAGGVPDSVRLAVVTEPTDNKVVLGEKGYVPFDLVAAEAIRPAQAGSVDPDQVRTLLIRGEESHSARPREGRNALFETPSLEELAAIDGDTVLSFDCCGVRNKVPGLVAVTYVPRDTFRMDAGGHDEVRLERVLDFLKGFEDLALDLASVSDDRFLPPEVTLNVGAVTRSGTNLTFACDLRFVPGFDVDAGLDRVRALASRTLGAVELRFPYRPLPPVWQELEPELNAAIGDRLDAHGKSAYTEAAVLSTLGVRSVIAGPGNLRVHRHDESIGIAALATGARLFSLLAGYGASLS
jgi:acetylornithine deacetylase/succinyl-diaminopimelate desuccinylase-like protein